GKAVALALEPLLLRLSGTAALVAGENLLHEPPGFAPPGLEAGSDSFGVFAELADVEHGVPTVTQRRGAATRQGVGDQGLSGWPRATGGLRFSCGGRFSSDS